MKKLTTKVVVELTGGALALGGAALAAISSQYPRWWIGVYVGVGCILFGWAAFTISQIEEK